jgi:hypothetical protein
VRKRPKTLTPSASCTDLREELGVDLLGTTGPADRSAVYRHLACCPACRTELAALAGLPALPGPVSSTEAGTLLAAIPAPPTLPGGLS